jgi:hypothetical protein
MARRSARSEMTMRITACTLKGNCHCRDGPPRSPYGQPLPAAMFVCHESRSACLRAYGHKKLELEYDKEGNAVPPSSPDPTETPSFRGRRNEAVMVPVGPARTGVHFNPKIDLLFLKMLIKEYGQLEHLAAVVGAEFPELERVVLRLAVAMPPGHWSRSASYTYWRDHGWGAGGKWVPKHVLKCGGLREVVLFIENKATVEILPLEWRERMSGIWTEKMEILRKDWPEEWNGTIPTLRWVEQWEDI